MADLSLVARRRALVFHAIAAAGIGIAAGTLLGSGLWLLGVVNAIVAFGWVFIIYRDGEIISNIAKRDALNRKYS